MKIDKMEKFMAKCYIVYDIYVIKIALSIFVVDSKHVVYEETKMGFPYLDINYESYFLQIRNLHL